MGVVAGVFRQGAGRNPVERRQGHEEATLTDGLGHGAIEEGDQQGRDVGAVDVSVGHDDDALIAQVFDVEPAAGLDAQGQGQVRQFDVGAQLVGGGRGDVQDLAAQGQDGLGGAVAGLLGRAAGRVALDDEEFGALGGLTAAVRQLAGQAQLAGGGGALDFLVLAAAQAVLGAVDDEAEQGVGLLGAFGQPVVEGVAQQLFRQLLTLGRGQAVLGLALEFRVADEDGNQGARVGDDVLGRDLGGALLVDQLAVSLEALDQGGAEAGLVRAAVGGRDGVAVGADEAVGVAEADRRPGDGPFQRARLALALGAASEDGGDGLQLAHALGQGVGQTAGEVEQGLFGRGVRDAVRRAGPFDLDAAEQIGLGAGHAEQAGGLEGRADAEDLLVGLEADQGALLLRRADLLDGAEDVAAAEGLTPLEAVAPDGDVQLLGQGVDHRDADAVQAARGLIGLARELAARVQHGHDHFQRRLARVLGVRVDGDAAAVVADRQEAVCVQIDGDQLGVLCDGLVHRVVEDFGEQMVEGALVGAADIHAGALADGLQPLQHLDRGGGIAGGGRCRRAGVAGQFDLGLVRDRGWCGRCDRRRGGRFFRNARLGGVSVVERGEKVSHLRSLR